MANFPHKINEKIQWLDKNETDSNHFTSSEDEDWTTVQPRKRIHTGNPKTPGEPRTSTWPSRVFLPMDIPPQECGEDQGKNPLRSHRINDIIADHGRSMNPEQTVRLIGPIIHPSLVKRNPEVKRNLDLEHYNSQGPDLKYRLDLVLDFISNPNVKLDPLKVPTQFENLWLAPLKQIHRKKLTNAMITATEETFLD